MSRGGIITIPTRGLATSPHVLLFPAGGALGYQLVPWVGPTQRIIIPGTQPRVTAQRLISGFTMPFIMQIIAQGGGGKTGNPDLPAVQMEIFDNNTLVYSTGLAVVQPEQIAESEGNSSSGWGVLAADLTNPIAIEANSQLEIGVRGVTPIMGAGGEVEILMITNYSPIPGVKIENTIGLILQGESEKGPGQGGGPGNFRYEEIDK